MSQENIELVRVGYDAWNRRDTDAFMAWFDDAIEVILPEQTLDPGPHRGREAVRGFLTAWIESWEESTIEARRLVDAGDCVVAVVRLRSRGRGSGVQVDVENGHLWKIRDGKVVYARIYADPAEALAAVRGRGIAV
jgi:uncharacterized protein